MLLRRTLGAACAVAALVVPLAGCAGQDDAARSSGSGERDSTTPDEPFDQAKLEQLAGEVKDKHSSCFLVAQQGEVAGEWYFDGATAEKPQEVYSVTKSVTSTLVGLAQAEGDLSIDDSAADYIPQWKGTPSEAVTVRDLLANDSGRTFDADTDVDALIAAQDRTAYALAAGQEDDPGTVWEYNNTAIQTLDAVLRAATGEDTATYAQDRLFGPLGMTHTTMTADPSGTSTNVFFGIQSTCHDLERFGQLFAQRGQWEGQQLLPEEWVQEAIGDSSQDLNADYGLLWWLNRGGQEVPGASPDLYAAVGLGGQVVLVDPDSETVVVRLAPLEDEDYGFYEAARVITEALND